MRPWPKLFLFALSTLAISGCGTESTETAEPTEQVAETETPVRTARPEVREVIDSVSLAADLLPYRRAVLAAEVPGTMERLPVQEGQALAAGSLVGAIDTRSLKQSVAEAEAVFRRAEAQLGRAKSLFEKRSITQKNLLDAVTDHDVAEARLAGARLDLEKSILRAPWAGKISRKYTEVGAYLNPGEPVVELVEVSRLKVRAPAPASDVRYLQVGTPVVIRVDALGDASFEGTVVRLGAELDPGARTLDVEAELANPEGLLRPGFFARIELTRRVLEDALLVPLEAIVDLGDRQAVFLYDDGLALRREVELGPTIGEQVVVKTGLDGSSEVIVEGGLQIGDGQKVRRVERRAETTVEEPVE